MSLELAIPQEIHTSDKACADFILSLNERLAKVSAIEKSLKEAKEYACDVMLQRLEATGQKHFAFDDLGTFAKKTSEMVSFPTAENGGKEAGVKWLIKCVELGVIPPEQLMDIQQARLVTDTLLAVEEAVKTYNDKQKLNGGETIPDSPFNHYIKQTLSTPRKRK